MIDTEAGSTATILTEIFRRREIPVSADEATLLLLGFYEDTGSLTYANTGPREFRAAAWLVERGGDLGRSGATPSGASIRVASTSSTG